MMLPRHADVAVRTAPPHVSPIRHDFDAAMMATLLLYAMLPYAAAAANAASAC